MSPFTRRTLVKGAAAGLLAPFYREVLAQNPSPMRLVIVLECNCFYPHAVLSAGTRAALGPGVGTRHNFLDTYPSTALVRTGDDVSTALCLASLGTGGVSLVNRSAVVLGLSSTITGGGHSSGTGALSCAVHASSATFDAVMAPKLKASAPFDAIRLGTSSSLTPIVYETCSFGPKKPAGILVNPALAYDTIFGSIASSSGGVGQERSMLFDFARDDVRAALGTFKGSSNERLKLERYLTSLEALRTREGQLRSMAASVRPLLPTAPGSNPLLTTAGSPPDALKWLEAQFEIATTALVGGLTNVMVLASGSSGFDVHYDLLGGIGRHDLQHGIDNTGYWPAIASVTTRHVELIAKLARTLAATPEVGASGSMLDRTVILFMSDNGEQHHSEAREWPALLVGGNALGLKTDGRTVVYPGEGAANNRQFSNLFNTLGHALGDPTMNTFGSEGTNRIAPGPLSELI